MGINHAICTCLVLSSYGYTSRGNQLCVYNVVSHPTLIDAELKYDYKSMYEQMCNIKTQLPYKLYVFHHVKYLLNKYRFLQLLFLYQ